MRLSIDESTDGQFPKVSLILHFDHFSWKMFDRILQSDFISSSLIFYGNWVLIHEVS